MKEMNIKGEKEEARKERRRGGEGRGTGGWEEKALLNIE